MADRPGEDSFDALRAGRQEVRAVASEPAAAPLRPAQLPQRPWRRAAAGLMVLGVIAGGTALAVHVRERGLSWLGVPQQQAEAGAQAAAAVETEALARRLSGLEAELAALRAGPPDLPAAGPEARAMGQRLAALEAEARRLAEAEAASAAKLAQLAADMAAAGVTSGAVAAATAEARDIFLLVSLRRLMEQGRPLGAFDPLLRRQFETREPSAVAALVGWSSAPVGRAGLAERLDALAAVEPAADGGAGAGFWSRLWQRLSSLVEIRQGAQTPASPLVQARTRLAEGDLAAAIALVAALPPTPEQAAWLADAERLQAAEDALDRLELLVVQAATVIPAS
ncbi:hypothetical protein [Thermaurantiacus sp.]